MRLSDSDPARSRAGCRGLHGRTPCHQPSGLDRIRGPQDDAVLTWNENAGEAATAACIAPLDNPLHESRMYAIMHIAIHDALNAIDRRSRPYAYNMRVEQRTSPDAAVAAAARRVLITLINQLPPELTPATCIPMRGRGGERQADYAAALAMIPDGPAKTRGIALGEAAAARSSTCESHRRSGRSVPELRLPPGHRARRVPVPAGHPVHRLRGMGERDPLRAEEQLPVPSPTALPGHQQEVRRRLQRGEVPRR